MSKTRKILVAVSIVLMPLAIVMTSFYFDISKPFKIEEKEYYFLKTGSSVIRLAHDLEKRNFIKYPRFLILYSKLMGNASELKAGEYVLNNKTSAKSLLTRMVAGDVILHSITIVEGWTFRQVLKHIESNENLVKKIDYDQDILHIAAQLGYSGRHPEGYLLPETYSFPRGTSDIEFLQRAWRAMEKVISAQWEQRAPDLPLKNQDEALTLASIIEKETGNESERKLIASVFINRLRKRMALGTDPTIIYGLGDDFDGDITFKHLRTDTPYNTRTRKGLPPTPIAMPGLASIHAALHPENSDMLYFVAQGAGKHYFSKTLAEHEAAVDQYQRKRRK